MEQPGDGSDDLFDEYDAFVEKHVRDPGPFLDGHDLLCGEGYVAFHEITRDLFEERTVYNLARLNLNTRHPNAGYRYAEEADDPSILRAEFTPSTPFCPQAHTLTIGSFRAWNGLTEQHDYDLGRVCATPMHHDSGSINDRLADIEETFEEIGSVEGIDDPSGSLGPSSSPSQSSSGIGDLTENAPF
ncbi:MAG: hypothetical protein RI560_03035 [Natronomonas sp.]|nr:hypothetical protein [Natronomonas sp.]MDR9380632.1 hypothetical protein [Natronomonas sp.]MDR9430983.1 hypothetical protein [Natronomonas sp.]